MKRKLKFFGQPFVFEFRAPFRGESREYYEAACDQAMNAAKKEYICGLYEEAWSMNVLLPACKGISATHLEHDSNCWKIETLLREL